MTATLPPLVSLCVPTYNSALFVQETLESLLCQTYPNIEIIVSDNASNDGTPAILCKYASTHGVKVLQNEVNVGAGGNFNRLVSEARGEFIAIYHADDVYAPTIVAESVAVFQRDKMVGLVGTMAEVINSAGSHLYSYSLPDSGQQTGRDYFDFDEVMLALLRTRRNKIFFVTPSIMVRRDIYQELGLFDQATYRSSVDYEMWLRIAAHYPVVVIARTLMSYRIHSGQGSELEVRKNTELPDILAVILAYRCFIRDRRVLKVCDDSTDRTILKTAIKQNYMRLFETSSATLSKMSGMKYKLYSWLLKLVNAFRINLRIWP